MNTFLIGFILLASFSAHARITDKKEQIKISKNKVELTLKSGFHFNAEAPASAYFDDQKESIKPNPKTEALFVFTAPDLAKKAKLKFYVCDDAKTACEQHEHTVVLTPGKASSAVEDALKPTEPNSKIQVATLKKSEKPTLLMFTAPWCPACIRMETETYNQASMKAELNRLETKKINIDLPENAELSEQFHVKAIPTAVLINKDGDELNRWLDFQSASLFSKQLHENLQNSEILSDLQKKALAGDSAAITKVGFASYNAMNCQEAVRWLSLSRQKEDQKYKLASEVACAEQVADENDINKNEYLLALDKASMLTSSQLDQVRWSLDLLEKFKEMKSGLNTVQPRAEKLLTLMNSLFSSNQRTKRLFAESTYGDTGGFQSEEVLLMKARIYALLDKSGEKQIAFNEIKNRINKRKLSVSRPGEMLLAIAYLREAGEKVHVEKLYNQLITRNPKTYVYLEKYARYLFGQKQNEKALVEINKAINYAEGNQPQLWLLKARIQKDLKKKDEALRTVNEILGFDKIAHRKFKKVLAQSETLKKDLTTDRAQD